MQLQLEIGSEFVRSYKRMDYKPWHAIAEFVDNSTQSYRDHRDEIDAAFEASGGNERFCVRVVLDRKGSGLLRIVDNAMGMSEDDLRNGLRLGHPPSGEPWRSRYGLGMKMAACWFGNYWTIKTSKLGEPLEIRVTLDVEAIADGNLDLPVQTSPANVEDHYTIVEISELNQRPRGRTLGYIKDFLRSMYRIDLREDSMVLEWNGEPLVWEPDENFVQAKDGSFYKKDFSFQVNNKRASGWVGVLDRGSRAKAGFSILHSGRVVRGWPQSYRPESIFGDQIGGVNNLINQRVTGELHLDDYLVTASKDGILWEGDEEHKLEMKLAEHCQDYATFAQSRRRGEDERGPKEEDVSVAVEELQAELDSSELADLIDVEEVPPPDVVTEQMEGQLEGIDEKEVRFSQTWTVHEGEIKILGYLEANSANDPYVVHECSTDERILVLINMNHPHVMGLNGAEGLVNYLRHCTYDAVAEWQATRKTAAVHPDTVRLLKDKLLRLPSVIEMGKLT